MPLKRLLFPISLGILLITSAVILSCTSGTRSKERISSIKSSTGNYHLEKIIGGLQSPTALADPADGSGRIFFVEQQGVVRILDHGKLLAEPFLDLRAQVIPLDHDYDERGLLGIALHPDFRAHPIVYVFYSARPDQKGSDCKSVIARYNVSAQNINKADESSGRILLQYHKPESNHNGGQLCFGPDGFLYVGVGDGGGADDEHGPAGNGQNLSTYLGKILRIDVDHRDPYAVPADNPFVKIKDAKPEIFAYGLRNPWRFSFDTGSGLLFCGDVGQDKYEEVDIIQKGGNYGWKKMEATHCFSPSRNCDTSGLILPIDEYKHGIGISITGGFIYRGKSIPQLEGKYLFADWSGPLFYLSESNNKWVRSPLQIDNKPGKMLIESFGQDHQGEVYLLTSVVPAPFDKNGAIYKLIP